MTIELVYGVVLIALSIAVLAITISLRKLDRKIEKIDSVTSGGLASMAHAVSDLVETTSSLSDKLSEFELDPVSKQIDEAKQEVLSEWIKNITEYDPYTKAPHRGE